MLLNVSTYGQNKQGLYKKEHFIFGISLFLNKCQIHTVWKNKEIRGKQPSPWIEMAGGSCELTAEKQIITDVIITCAEN